MNKCDSHLHRGLSGDWYLSARTLFRYERMIWHLFYLSWERVQRVALVSVGSVWCTLSGVVFVIWVLLLGFVECGGGYVLVFFVEAVCVDLSGVVDVGECY